MEAECYTASSILHPLCSILYPLSSILYPLLRQHVIGHSPVLIIQDQGPVQTPHFGSPRQDLLALQTGDSFGRDALHAFVRPFRSPSRTRAVLDVVDAHRFFQHLFDDPVVMCHVTEHAVDMKRKHLELGIAQQLEPILTRQQREIAAGTRVQRQGTDNFIFRDSSTWLRPTAAEDAQSRAFGFSGPLKIARADTELKA